MPDCLVFGHIVKDVTADGWTAGGCVVYAAQQAVRLGLETAAVTVCSPDVRPEAVVPGALWHVLPDSATTSFENRYRDGRREQRLLARARVLHAHDVPRGWLSTPLLLFAPVFHDIDEEAPAELRGALTGITAQGWLRRLEGERVLPGRFVENPAWLQADAVFLSSEDMQGAEAAAAWARGRVVVLTRGRAGCTLWSDGHRQDLPAYRATEVDPTGAGDVFAMAYLAEFQRTSDALRAAAFASAAAALSVGTHGLAGIATRDEIEAFLAVRDREGQPC